MELRIVRTIKIIAALVLIFSAGESLAQGSGTLRGTVIEKKSGLPVIGATVYLEEIKKGAATDIDGNYSVTGIPAGKYKVRIDCISYLTVVVSDLSVTAGSNTFDIMLEENATQLNEVVVTSVKRMNSEIAMVEATRSSGAVMSGISGRQISRSQDRSAAEVVKRIPGVSIINDRYIVVRGLAGRYNNVWINNNAVPSTDSDTRSFSFDMLPGSQLESIMIVKSPSAEIPSDFSGGFVKIMTKSMPSENETVITYGMNLNSATHFNDHFYNTASVTDFLGFDNGARGLKSVVPLRMDNDNKALVTKITKEGFRNDWSVKRQQPIPDQRLNVMVNRHYNLKGGSELGIVGALNYSHGYQTYADMQNARFGVYNSVSDQSEYIYNYVDNQYTIDDKIGAMLNITLLKGDHKIEFRNIFNQLGKNRYTTREGWQNISSKYIQEKQEYIYSARTTYTGQFSGSGKAGRGDYDWNAGYSYAGMNQPDRRIINREENNVAGDEFFGHMAIDQNEITRDFSNLDEHIFSLSGNYTLPVALGSEIKSEVKAGFYGEYKTRDNSNRQFFYRFNRYAVPADFVYREVVEKILTDENFSADKLYIFEDTDNRNSYKGRNMAGSAYMSWKIPAGRFNIIAGLRAETGQMRLTTYDKIYEFSTKDKDYNHFDLFPSLNASFNLDKRNLFRLAYGSSVNRQEFREVSPSVFYDFNLFSDVKGNPNLKQAKIHNFDLRYEYYPSADEYITFALFGKYFINPIEWTYLDAGGSYTYTFENALSATNYGVELDIRKNLGFLGVKELTLGLNAAMISSTVDFDQSVSLEKDRAMQGQSPYIVNASLFYDKPEAGLSAGIMYNRIGRRIVGIGRVDTGSGASINNDVPDTYELPRDIIDLVITKKIGKKTELKASFRDILNQAIVFEQYPRYIDGNGEVQERRQVAKSFKPGAGLYLGIQYKF
ncbi:MAG: TonB-dependent receptor [Bacteroidetes bacterium HGW-Bacteroidetes-14]|nr:MAG: TonB-dependent receptor [Bacteroidetes bacterium HGW-Bacteroidetes-14]